MLLVPEQLSPRSPVTAAQTDSHEGSSWRGLEGKFFRGSAAWKTHLPGDEVSSHQRTGDCGRSCVKPPGVLWSRGAAGLSADWPRLGEQQSGCRLGTPAPRRSPQPRRPKVACSL